ncbi:MAG: asparagine synthase-related protein [Pyrinomonadaceae bacterium]
MVDAALLTDTMTYLPNDLLTKVDIATMAVSLKRSPFLDHHVIDFAASLPENLKLRGLSTKYVLKKALKELLPLQNLTRRKMGFGVPISHWLRQPLLPMMRETLLGERAARRGMLRAETVRRLIDEHVARRADHAHRLWTLLMLELWFERFID